ncbi:hypothetical protein [Mesorhizobium sp.]|uniref:hypothetical protein n=1 Tax=Mesorhizobium sp. TaxID=1871066 RepID=UPI0025F2F928|nr:hypothetical protein [Mesorhizobium sp.]
MLQVGDPTRLCVVEHNESAIYEESISKEVDLHELQSIDVIVALSKAAMKFGLL